MHHRVPSDCQASSGFCVKGYPWLYKLLVIASTPIPAIPSQPASTGHASTFLRYTDHIASQLWAGLWSLGLHTLDAYPALGPVTSIINNVGQKKKYIYKEVTRKVQPYSSKAMWDKTCPPYSQEEEERTHCPFFHSGQEKEGLQAPSQLLGMTHFESRQPPLLFTAWCVQTKLKEEGRKSWSYRSSDNNGLMCTLLFPCY